MAVARDKTLTLNAEQNTNMADYDGCWLSQAVMHTVLVTVRPPGEPHDRNAPFINKDKRCLFLGLPGVSSVVFHGSTSLLRICPPRPRRSREDWCQRSDSSDGAIEDGVKDGAIDRASLSSRIVSRDSVLAIEFSYNVGRLELMALDRKNEGATGGGGAGWKKLVGLVGLVGSVGVVDPIGRLKFCTGREGE